MNVCKDPRRLFIPQEILECICDYLASQPTELCVLRLVCKALNAIATSLIIELSRSNPSELFCQESVDDTTHALSTQKPITIWTEIDVPKNVAIGDRSTPEGMIFRELVLRPDPVPRDMFVTSATAGRKAICWGLLREREVLLIAHQYDSERSWARHRLSDDVREMSYFLEEVAPRSIGSSRSERIHWPPREPRRRPLFSGYSEIRTVYFDASMTTSQRTGIETTFTNHCSALNSASSVIDLGSREWLRNYPSHDPVSWGAANWTWLPGLRLYQGQVAVAARCVFDWRDKESEMNHYAALQHRDPGAMFGFSSEGIDAAIVLGSESEHCVFVPGAWRN